MSKHLIKNVPASIRSRILNKAREQNRSFNELLQYYAMERFLYRLSISQHADKFILKGALMLSVWHSHDIRPTMDIDMLGKTSNTESDIISQIKDILSVNIEPDGMIFDSTSIQTEPISEDSNYNGVRVRFKGLLDTAKVNIQMDIGFGDVIYPIPTKLTLPTILGTLPPQLLCYSRESAIAEKFEAMIKLGELNSRMKDFYDIWLLAREFEFEGAILLESLKQTFNNRKTVLTNEIPAFSQRFITVKQVHWKAFQNRLRNKEISSDFNDIVLPIKDFITPVVNALLTTEIFSMKWSPSDGWLQ